MTRARLTTLYHYIVALIGLSVLWAFTSLAWLEANRFELLLFLTLSLLVKRAGFEVLPYLKHSLVGIVDLAGLMVFGMAGGWVASLSAGLYSLGTQWRHRNLAWSEARQLAAFRFGLKALMSVGGVWVFTGLGGNVPLMSLALPIMLPLLALCLTWFALDHLAWTAREWLVEGMRGVTRFWRLSLTSSVWVELLPLPISALIAYLFTTAERELFLLVALGMSLASIAVRRLFDLSLANRRRQRELETLNDFGREVNMASLDEAQIIELIYQHASRLADTSNFAISLIDERAQQVDLRLWYRRGTRQPPRVYQLGGISAWVAENNRPLLVRDFHAENLPQRSLVLTDMHTRSALFVPVLSQERTIGMIALQSDEPQQFNEDHERIFAAMANQAAIAIEQARLYRAEQRRARQLQTIAEVSQRVAGIFDLQELMEFVVAIIKVNFGYYHVDIYLLERGILYHRASTDVTEISQRATRLRQTSLISTVAQSGEALMVNDVAQDTRFRFDPAAPQTAAELIVPLKAEGKVLGVLEVQADQVGAFSASDIFVVQTLGDQVALAIQEARLFNDVQQEAYVSNALLQVAEAVGNLTDVDAIMQSVVRITPLLIGVERSLILLWDGVEHELVGAASYGLDAEQARQFQHSRYDVNHVFSVSPVSHEPTQPITLPPDIAQAWRAPRVLALPLMVRGVMLGMFCVDAPKPPEPRRMQLLSGIANQTALAIEAAQLEHERDKRADIEKELSIGRNIQATLLPDCPPQIAGFELAAVWLPALQVSGDFYDFLPLQEERWGIVVADVADKGVPAAIYMALARTILRTVALGKAARRAPHQVLERANEIILSDARADLFVTVFYAVLEPASRSLRYSSAGHNPPLLLRFGASQGEWMRGRGMALGVQATIELDENLIALQPGDVLVMYTDGITDAMNEAQELFGRDRLQTAAMRARYRSAQAVLDSILDAVHEFVGRTEQADDLTMVVLRCQ